MPKKGKILNAMKLEFLSHPENVGLARVAVASFAAQVELTLNDLEEIKVAVSEAVSNAMIHGYKDRPDGVVRVLATRFEEGLEIKVEDEGNGIPDVELAMKPTYSSVPERMGLGLAFVKSFMDEVEMASEVNEGTRVIMTKYLKPVQPSKVTEIN